MTVELDHVILVVSGPDRAAARLPGCTLDPGRRHTGQGTSNRRAFFHRSYVEVLWVDVPEDERRSGLGFAERAAPGAACPFGVVLRGQVHGPDRDLFTSYTVPDGSGMTLLLLAGALADPRLPFVAVWETADADLSSRWPVRRVPSELLAHPTGVRDIARVRIQSPAVPRLGGLRPRDVEFAGGVAQLRLDLAGARDPYVFD
jgi:hypothetical protein